MQDGGGADGTGLAPRCAAALFSGVQELSRGGRSTVRVFVSFTELYLEQVRDLGKLAAALQGELVQLFNNGAPDCSDNEGIRSRTRNSSCRGPRAALY